MNAPKIYMLKEQFAQKIQKEIFFFTASAICPPK